MITRRTLLKGISAGGVIATGFSLGNFYTDSALAAEFENRLKIPPLLRPTTEGAVSAFNLNIRNGSSQFFKGVNTPTIGVNGDYLGPTLLMRKGTKVRLNVSNDLEEPTTLHWHGLHLPAKNDGGPHQVVQAGERWLPEFEIKNEASTYWYHGHMLHKTGSQVWKGLAGLIIIEDENSDHLPLPKQYGVDDIPLVLQDRRFNETGNLEYLSFMPDLMMGMRGDVMLVNGSVRPWFEATTDKIRFRLLNGSNARNYNLGFNDGRTFKQITSDGGFLEQSIETKRLFLSPGERAEIIVDIPKDQKLVLRNFPSSRNRMSGMGMMGHMMGGVDDNERYDILEIRPSENLKPMVSVPEKLVNLPEANADQVARTRRFTMEMGMGMGMMMGKRANAFTINGRSMDLGRIDERVKLGDTEIWELSNLSPLPHPFHIHDVQFRILDRNRRPPYANEHGFKDTVLVGPQEVVRVLVSFRDYADENNPYMYHCHILEHEDAGMMGQFVVEG